MVRPLATITFRELLLKAELCTSKQGGPRIHDLRHTYATLELENCESPLFVARQLGHSTPETTFRRYARFMKRVARTGPLVDRLSRAEFRQKPSAQAGVVAERETENIRGLAERLGGAGGGVRTRAVQLGKLAFYH